MSDQILNSSQAVASSNLQNLISSAHLFVESRIVSVFSSKTLFVQYSIAVLICYALLNFLHRSRSEDEAESKTFNPKKTPYEASSLALVYHYWVFLYLIQWMVTISNIPSNYYALAFIGLCSSFYDFIFVSNPRKYNKKFPFLAFFAVVTTFFLTGSQFLPDMSTLLIYIALYLSFISIIKVIKRVYLVLIFVLEKSSPNHVVNSIQLPYNRNY